MQRVRDLQDETGGFTAFIPWTFQRENTALGRKIKDEPTGIDYLKMLAVSRLFLDNIENIQSSWLTQGLKLGQVALRFGADDMGSIMIEENVVSAAGAHNRADEQMLRYLIREAGFIPQQRDILYARSIARKRPAATSSQSTPLPRVNRSYCRLAISQHPGPVGNSDATFDLLLPPKSERRMQCRCRRTPGFSFFTKFEFLAQPFPKKVSFYVPPISNL